MGYQSVFKQDLFAGRTVVITGGGSGIGRCTAHELAALGASVAIVGRNTDKLDAVRAEIRSDGGRVSVHSADIRDEGAVSDVIDAILAEHGRIDGLFNNAGGQYRAPLEAISTKGFEAVVRNASFVTGTCIRVDGGAPNAKPGWWELQPAQHNTPFDGFHRSALPAILDASQPN